MALGVQSWAGLRRESGAHGAASALLGDPRSGLIVNILSWLIAAQTRWVGKEREA